jgi:hypothetical protein
MTKTRTNTKTKTKVATKAKRKAKPGVAKPRTLARGKPKGATPKTKPKLAPPKATVRRLEPAAARPRAESADLSQEQLDQLQDSLYEIYTKLDALKPSAEENAAWTEQYTAVTDAIRVLRNHQLDRINSRLKGDAANVASAIDDANAALREVQDTARILQVVGNALKAIASIAALV